MNDLQKPFHRVYDGLGAEAKTKEELLKMLRSMLDEGKGFALSAVFNVDGQACMVQCAIGILSIEMLDSLIKDTVLFSQKITKESSIVEDCQCPECQAERERKNISSSVH